MISNLIVDGQEGHYQSELKKNAERLGHHQSNINTLWNFFADMEKRMELLELENVNLNLQIKSLADHACHCGNKTPVGWQQKGSKDDPLEYADSKEYYTPPVTTAPLENSTPIPIALSSTLEVPSENKENVPSCCCLRSAPADCLIPISEEEEIKTVDKAEEDASGSSFK